MIYWLYGQPGSGKTTLAKELIYHLDTHAFSGSQITHIDIFNKSNFQNNELLFDIGDEKKLKSTRIFN